LFKHKVIAGIIPQGEGNLPTSFCTDKFLKTFHLWNEFSDILVTGLFFAKIARLRAGFSGNLRDMKLTWKERFVALLRQSQGDMSEVAYAQRLGIKRQTLQRIMSGRTRLDYSNVETALRNLGLHHCAICAMECPYGPGAGHSKGKL
jgi:hypothetical protein